MVVFTDGFENGFSAWVTSNEAPSSQSIVASPTHTGGFAAKFALAAGWHPSIASKTLANSYNSLFFRFYVYGDTLPANPGDRVVLGAIGNYNHGVILAWYNDAGTVKWQISGKDASANAWGPALSAFSPAPNTWYSAELELNNTYARLYIGDVLEAEATGLNLQAESQINVGGWVFPGIAGNYYVDDVVADIYRIGPLPPSPITPLTNSIQATTTTSLPSAGGTVTFQATVTGGTSPLITWNEGGTPVSGATGSQITLGFLANTGTTAITYSVTATATDSGTPPVSNSPLTSNPIIVTVAAPTVPTTYTLTVDSTPEGIPIIITVVP
jgi:hypothetical protein